ncbi:8-oxo-dGTP diphosphatase MutT [Legionella lytica]|uniref:8-oxo-dGTP diphosphatase n=1 Tax=Legionella lytica TaxID=96232 RepID=A0ABY4YBY7_9GAMM|nr:8-oxo-dGTP diphosphatase MutT [Legionella lytica]USQ15168.1 8-oxo-dGTP diphosphatase MutT [Legionella lytica]
MKVAVAIIIDEQQRILVTQRPLHASHGGYWEFPGGKLEANELAEQALIREIKEEVGLDVLKHEFLGEVHHQYAERSVQLFIFLVTQFSGSPTCIEGQLAMKWIHQNELNPDEFPEANREVMQLIPKQ